MSPKTVTMRRMAANAPEHPVMLGIAGDSAAGKTTLTHGLTGALGDGSLAAMCADDYHRFDREERRARSITPLNPACNYMSVMEQHLQLVALGEPILKPVYDHDDGTLRRPVLFEPRDIVIVEGLLPLHSRLSRACLDLSVYLDPPEEIRRRWKIVRDTHERGYSEDQVVAELGRRECDSADFIRPQRRWADIVVRFAPIAERGESGFDPLSATVLLRPTAPHPDLSTVLGDDNRQAIHLKLIRDDDGRPVDALHIHAHASRESARRIEEVIWGELGIDADLPPDLGVLPDGGRSEPLAVVQLILLYHLVIARRQRGAELVLG